MSLTALQESFDVNDLEADIKAILTDLYDQNLKAMADEINTYGAAHLGPFHLIERLITADGLAIIRRGDEAGLRYLWKAWKYLNPERGLHFLRTYLQVLWPDSTELVQLWQDKSQPYPTALLSPAEIIYMGANPDDYFLTSRVMVDIDTDIVPDRIIESLRTALAAKYVLKVRVAKFASSVFGVGAAGTCVNLHRTKFKVPVELTLSAVSGATHTIDGVSQVLNYLTPNSLGHGVYRSPAVSGYYNNDHGANVPAPTRGEYAIDPPGGNHNYWAEALVTKHASSSKFAGVYIAAGYDAGLSRGHRAYCVLLIPGTANSPGLRDKVQICELNDYNHTGLQSSSMVTYELPSLLAVGAEVLLRVERIGLEIHGYLNGVDFGHDSIYDFDVLGRSGIVFEYDAAPSNTTGLHVSKFQTSYASRI